MVLPTDGLVLFFSSTARAHAWNTKRIGRKLWWRNERRRREHRWSDQIAPSSPSPAPLHVPAIPPPSPSSWPPLSTADTAGHTSPTISAPLFLSAVFPDVSFENVWKMKKRTSCSFLPSPDDRATQNLCHHQIDLHESHCHDGESFASDLSCPQKQIPFL